MPPAPHLLHVFSTFAPGGPQVRTVQLMEGLGAGWRHSVLAMDGHMEARELVPANLDFHPLEPAPRSPTLAAVRRLRGLIRRERPDLILTYNWGAIEAVLAARLSGLTVLHHEDGFLPDELDGFKKRRVWTRRLVLRGAHSVIVPSKKLEGIALSLWRLGSRVHYIPNGIRVERFSDRSERTSVRRAWGVPPDAFVVGSCGHLRGEKNPVRLVHAFGAMESRDAHLVVLGDGPERPAVLDAAREAGVNERVHLLGHQEDPVPFYSGMDAFALSSDTEQMPVALLEAMAAGLPVASTDVGDVRAMLPPDQGQLVVDLHSPAPAGALARALDRLAVDEPLRGELGRANFERVLATYSFESMLAAYRDRYAAALGLKVAGA